MTAAQLDAELARCRSDPHFVGWAISRWCADTRQPRKAVIARLGLTDDQAASLEIRMLPRTACFTRDLARLARESGARKDTLAALCRAAYAAQSHAPAHHVADTLGLTPRRVYQLRGPTRAKPRVTDADRAQIRELLAKGKTRREVVRLTGRSRKVVDAVAHGA